MALLRSIKSVKRECRLARDNSEDAVTWNVFRYLETTGQLAGLLAAATQTDQQQAELIYWSYSQPDQTAWPALNRARKEFGENLQRSTEPDLIALTKNGLFFIETKLTATNVTTPSERSNPKKYLSGGDEWFRQVFISDYETIAIKSRLYELFRLWLLGSWIATQTSRDFTLLNIVLSAREQDIEPRFTPHIRQEPNRRFKRVAWEEIYCYITDHAPDNEEKRVILDYFRNKAIGYDRFGKLQKAFTVGI